MILALLESHDSDRARECIEHSDNYNKMWAYGYEDSLRTKEECGELINNPNRDRRI